MCPSRCRHRQNDDNSRRQRARGSRFHHTNRGARHVDQQRRHLLVRHGSPSAGRQGGASARDLVVCFRGDRYALRGCGDHGRSTSDRSPRWTISGQRDVHPVSHGARHYGRVARGRPSAAGLVESALCPRRDGFDHGRLRVYHRGPCHLGSSTLQHGVFLSARTLGVGCRVQHVADHPEFSHRAGICGGPHRGALVGMETLVPNMIRP